MRKRANTRRTKTGSGIVEGVVGLILVIAGVVGGTLLLINCGISTFYKEKLGFAANEVAHYAANLPSNTDPTPKATQFAESYAKAMGLPELKVQCERLTLQSEPAVRVTLSTNALPLIGHLSMFPEHIGLQDSAVALRNSWKPDYLLTLSLRQNAGNTMVTVPCYGRYFRDGAQVPGAGYPSFPVGGHFWMDFPEGGFTAEVNGQRDTQIFGNGSSPMTY